MSEQRLEDLLRNVDGAGSPAACRGGEGRLGMEGLLVHGLRGLQIAPSHGASGGSGSGALMPLAVETLYPSKDQDFWLASHTGPPDDVLLAATLCSGSELMDVLCALARLKTAPIYFLSARWSSPCGPRRLLGRSMSRRGTLFGSRSARGLSGGRQSGRPFSPHYGQYGSTRMKSSSGVDSPPPTR